MRKLSITEPIHCQTLMLLIIMLLSPTFLMGESEALGPGIAPIECMRTCVSIEYLYNV